MSDTQAKKKVEFKKLNLDKISNPSSSSVPVAVKEEAPVSLVKEGCWLFGKALAEVTSAEFREWITEKIPSASSWEEDEINTPKKKEKIIISLGDNYNGLLYLPKPKTKPKQYKH